MCLNEAIFQATIQLLNEIGFSEISMSKIAKRANVSPNMFSTIRPVVKIFYPISYSLR